MGHAVIDQSCSPSLSSLSTLRTRRLVYLILSHRLKHTNILVLQFTERRHVDSSEINCQAGHQQNEEQLFHGSA